MWFVCRLFQRAFSFILKVWVIRLRTFPPAPAHEGSHQHIHIRINHFCANYFHKVIFYQGLHLLYQLCGCHRDQRTAGVEGGGGGVGASYAEADTDCL